MRSTLCLLALILAPLGAAAQISSGTLIWADATNESTDTGNEVCAVQGQPPQSAIVDHVCVTVFVPGSATEVACDADMTGAATASGYFLALCK